MANNPNLEEPEETSGGSAQPEEGVEAQDGKKKKPKEKKLKKEKTLKAEKPPKIAKGKKGEKSAKPPKAAGARGAKKEKQVGKVRFTRRSFFLKLLVRIMLFFLALSRKLQIDKVRMKGLKPPFIILCNHQSFTDYAVVERAAHPFDVNHICEVSEFVDSESLMNSLGCLPIRRFVADSKLFYHLRETLMQKKIAAIYPEAHFSFDGTDSPLPDMIYKMFQTLKVPVVVVKVRGTYISHPCWSRIDHKTPLEAVVTQVFSHAEIQSADEATIKTRVLSAFHYDDLWWQLQNSIHISSHRRAEGLENIFYLCPVCRHEYTMSSKDDTVYCTHCKQAWTLTDALNLTMVDGSLDMRVLEQMQSERNAIAQNEADKSQLKKAQDEHMAICRQHEIKRANYERAVADRQRKISDAALMLGPPPVFTDELVNPGLPPEFVPPTPVKVSVPPPEPPPDISRITHWMEFQREEVLHQLQNASYDLNIPVQVELLENISRGFIPLGGGMLEHNASGFTLTYRNPKTGRQAMLHKAPLASYSCHVDFDYNGKGPFIDLSTTDQTFYLYPDTDQCSVTKVALATEEIYKLAQAIVQEKENSETKAAEMAQGGR